MSFDSLPAGGPLLALSAAALWAVSPMFMASAGRRVGSFPVVLLRSLLASLLLATAVVVATVLAGGRPAVPTAGQAAWLALSGVIGVGVGDVLIYEAFVTLGPRRSIQTLVLAPVVAVLAGWAFLGEAMPARTLVGTAVILAATLYAVLAGQRRPAAPPAGSGPADDGEAGTVLAGGESGDVESGALELADVESVGRASDAAPPREPIAPTAAGEPGQVSVLGLLFAVGGAVCMGVGAVTGRQAFRFDPPVDPLSATFVRVAAAAAFLWLAPVARNRVGLTLALLRDRHVLSRVCVGTLLGPFVGMFCYVAALRAAPAGLVSTLVATSPLFAIPITMVRYRARIGWDVCAAAAVAAGGVGVLFLG